MTENNRELLLHIFARILFGIAGVVMLHMSLGPEHPLIAWGLSVVAATAWLYFTDEGRDRE